MKTKIPLWINILQVILLAILSLQTYACYFNPSLIYPGFTVDSSNAQVIYVLAGRNAVMAVISILALVKQDSRFYSFAFIMHSLREFQDSLIVGPLIGMPITMIAIFFVIFVIPEVIAYFKLNKIADGFEKQ